MFRHERPQQGRYRQFHQIDCEAFGYPGPDIDAEVIQVSARLWRKLGIRDLSLSVNSLGTPDARRRYRAVLVEYFSGRRAELDADSLRRLDANPLRILDSKNPAMRALIEGAPRLVDHLDDESRRHFDRFLELLAGCGIAADVDPRLVRGLDYYTRTVFEWRTTALGSQDAVCSGGRYDGLVELLGGEPTPAIGWALGIERVVGLLQAAGLSAAGAAPAIYLVMSGERAERAGLALAERLRDALPGAGVLANMEGGSFKAQMKRADRSGATLRGDRRRRRGVARRRGGEVAAHRRGAAGMALGRAAAPAGGAVAAGRGIRKQRWSMNTFPSASRRINSGAGCARTGSGWWQASC